MTAVMREGERVTPLELFFDLVFVLALTQCTTSDRTDADVGGHAQGPARARSAVVVVVWVRVADERGRSGGGVGALGDVRGDGWRSWCARCACRVRSASEALLFACAYAAVRAAHIVLFMLASRDDAELRHSVIGLAGSTAVRRGAVARRVPSREVHCSWGCGDSRSCSTWVARSCSARRAGSSCRHTSPSATERS